MIGELLGLLGALRSRSTRRRRSQVENHHEQLAGIREAVEIMVAIESTGSARAAPHGPNGPGPCASSARRVRGSGTSHARPFGLPCSLVRFMRTLGCWDMSGSRACACCGSMPCGIRARDQGGPASRFGCAGKLGCEHESVPPIVLPRCIDVYIWSSLRAGRSRVHF